MVGGAVFVTGGADFGGGDGGGGLWAGGATVKVTPVSTGTP